MHFDVVRADDNVTHVILVGRLDSAGVDGIADRLTAQIVARRKPAILDFDQVDFVASIGMGMLLTIAKSLNRFGTRMVLLRPRSTVRESLNLAGFHRVILMAEDETSALELLRGV